MQIYSLAISIAFVYPSFVSVSKTIHYMNVQEICKFINPRKIIFSLGYIFFTWVHKFLYIHRYHSLNIQTYTPLDQMCFIFVHCVTLIFQILIFFYLLKKIKVFENFEEISLSGNVVFFLNSSQFQK